MYTENIALAGSQHLLHRFFSADYESPFETPSHLERSGFSTHETRDTHHYVSLDDEQRLSAALQSEGECASNTYSNNYEFALQTSSPQVENASASPAAMFLSAFSSPPPAPACLPDDEGQVVSGYTLGDIIGYGGFSIIRRGFSMSGGVVAVKIIRRSAIDKGANSALMKKKLEHEAAVWASLCHEHILPLFSALHTSYADFFITLYCPAGSLFDILKRDGSPALPQDDAGMMFRQVVRGLRYMHEVAMYVHRDIKLENILVDEMGVCRIGDFGMAKKIGEIDEEDELLEEIDQYQYPDTGTVHRATSLTVPSSKRHARPSLQAHFPESRHHPVRHRNSTSSAQPSPSAHIFQPGSLPYAAPELLLPQTSGPLLPHPAQDIWALGTLLYALLTGRLPFTDSFEPRLQMKILNGVYEVPKDIGRGAERVLKGCLHRSLPGRWSIAMVDDVAWGIGWGAEGDDVTPADSDEEYEVHQTTCPTPSTSRSRSRPAETSVLRNDESQHDLGSSRVEAASRRSSSRAQRSLSRVPLLIGTGRSSGRSVSRPQSRPQSRPPSPTFSALNSSILTGDLLFNVSSPTFNDSALLTSPSPSVERGRRLNKLHIQSTSLSRSPSIVPSTPIDISGGHLAILDDSVDDDLPRDSPRGRKQFSQLHHVYTTSGEPISELDILDETTGWAAPQPKNTTYNSSHSARFQGARRISHDDPSAQLTRQAKASDSSHQQRRSGSTPPGSQYPWSADVVSAMFTDSPQSKRYSGENFLATPDSISTPNVKPMARSKSVEFGRSSNKSRRARH